MNTSKGLEAWAKFFVASTRLNQVIEDQLKAEGYPPLEVYDVLWTLERSEDHALRFTDLGERVLLSRCNVTRLAERLEGQGLIDRKRCPADRRGVYAALTKEGLKLRKDMWKRYSQLIEEHFAAHLSDKECEQLISIMKKVWSEPERTGEKSGCPSAV
jgi:DNA-binding MarR family transcriptional regulator